MKRLLVVLFFLPLLCSAQIVGRHRKVFAAAGGGGTPPSVVGCASGYKSATGTTLTVSYSPTAGNTLIVGYLGNANTTTDNVASMLASNSTALTRDSNVGVAGSYQMGFYRYTSVPAGITSVTMTQTSGTKGALSVCEVANLAASPVDVMDTAGAFANGGTWSTGDATGTSTNAIRFAFALTLNANSNTWGMTGYTILAGGKFGVMYGSLDGVMGYKVVSAGGSIKATGTYGYSPDYVIAVAASYKGN